MIKTNEMVTILNGKYTGETGRVIGRDESGDYHIEFYLGKTVVLNGHEICKELDHNDSYSVREYVIRRLEWQANFEEIEMYDQLFGLFRFYGYIENERVSIEYNQSNGKIVMKMQNGLQITI